MHGRRRDKRDAGRGRSAPKQRRRPLPPAESRTSDRVHAIGRKLTMGGLLGLVLGGILLATLTALHAGNSGKAASDPLSSPQGKGASGR